MPKAERKGKAAAKRDRGKTTGKPGRLWALVTMFGWNHRDAIGCGVAAVAIGAIMINGLFLQSGPHPAPMFRGDKLASATAAVGTATRPAVVTARARPAEPALGKAAVSAPARAPAEIVADIQRELVRRGFFEGVVDGRYGPRTDAAIRDFEQSAGLKASTEPSEALLQSIRRWNPKGAKTTGSTTASIAPAARPAAQPVRSDPIAEVLAPSKRVVAVQRALADFGYGQIKPTGVIDPETKAAIEKFEKERKLPVTGQVSDRFTRELAAITGRALD